MSTVLSQSPSTNRSSPISWIIQHELTLFFVFTFLLSWTFYGLVAIANLENNDTASIIILIGAYAPTISALVLSAITNPGSRTLSVRKWFMWFLLDLILVAGIEVLDHIFWEHQIDLGLILASAVLVVLAALVMTRLLANRAEVHLKLTGVTAWQFWVWVPFALGLWPLLVLTANAIARLVGLPVPPNPTRPDVAFPFLLIESFFWAFMFGGALNEEAGWRGFALPRLQGRFSPMISSIIIGAFWGLWHAPLHMMDVGMYGGNPWGALIRIMDIPRAILFTWLYNRTKGNLLIVMFFHAAINTTSYFLSRSHYVIFVLVLVVAILFVAVDKMWQRSP
ncbi:MAG TPA: CPBP family intramembrane glutamic endopeptidase [Anaerolineales bacterium]|nr:CPBP family intramembrane glutamic endopeptidase [Anaerolineales bacterium]